MLEDSERESNVIRHVETLHSQENKKKKAFSGSLKYTTSETRTQEHTGITVHPTASFDTWYLTQSPSPPSTPPEGDTSPLHTLLYSVPSLQTLTHAHTLSYKWWYSVRGNEDWPVDWSRMCGRNKFVRERPWYLNTHTHQYVDERFLQYKQDSRNQPNRERKSEGRARGTASPKVSIFLHLRHTSTEICKEKNPVSQIHTTAAAGFACLVIVSPPPPLFLSLIHIG